jgi:hypothetical protein
MFSAALLALVPLSASVTSSAQLGVPPPAKPAPKKKPKLKPAAPKADAPAADPAPAPATDTKKADSAPPEAPPASPPTPPAPAPAPDTDAISCSQDRIDSLVHDLNDWTDQLKDGEKKLRAERGCDQPNVVCLDRLGEPGADPIPQRVKAGQPLSVYAIVPAFDRGRITISTSIRASTAQSQVVNDAEAPTKPASSHEPIEPCKLTSLQKDTLKAAAVPLARFASQPGLETLTVPADSGTDAYWSSPDDMKILNDWLAWQKEPRSTPRFAALRARIDVPAGDFLSVDFSRVERGSRTPSIEKHYDLVIDNGVYYVEPALLVPFVYHGSRSVELTPTVSGTELRVGIAQDWRVTAAATVHIFPLGRQRGQVSSFKYCRYRSCIENWLGAEFGAGLDPIFRDWYLGVFFEPVSGFNIGFGAALLKGEFLVPGRAEGMLLPSADVPVKYNDYMVRGYFGASFSLDILETLDRGAAVTKKALF